MNGYSISYVAILICIFLYFLRNKSVNKISYILLCVFLIILSGLKPAWKQYGNDVLNYYMYYLKGDSWGYYTSYDIEPGLTYINRILRPFISDVYIYGLILSFLSIAPICYLYLMKSNIPLVSIFLYICMTTGGMTTYMISFCALRQCLAMGFVALAVYYYINNNYSFNKYVLLFLIFAFFTHLSSSMMIILFLLSKIKLSKRTILIIIFLAAISGFFIEQYIPTVQYLFFQLGKDFYTTQQGSFNYIMLLPFFLSSIFVFILSSESDCNSFEYKGLFLSLVLFGLIAYFNNNTGRFLAFFNIISYMAFAKFIKNYYNRHKFIIIGYIVILFFFCSISYIRFIDDFNIHWPYEVMNPF